MTCPKHEGKDKQIPMPILQTYIPKDMLEKMELRSVESIKDMIKCSACGQGYIPEGKFRSKIFTCSMEGCGKQTCRLCRHPAHKDRCTERINAIRMCKGTGMRIQACPVCLELYTKDNKCNRVKCGICKTEFCFMCSAVRDPTLKHNASYHRRNCPDYTFYENYDTVKVPNCPACKKEKKLCTPPADLEQGDIPLSEIAKIYL